MTLESQSVPPVLDQEAQTNRNQEDVKSDGNSEYKEQHPNAIEDVDLAKAMAMATQYLEEAIRDNLARATKLLVNPDEYSNEIENTSEARKLIESAEEMANQITDSLRRIKTTYSDLKRVKALIYPAEQKSK